MTAFREHPGHALGLPGVLVLLDAGGPQSPDPEELREAIARDVLQHRGCVLDGPAARVLRESLARMDRSSFAALCEVWESEVEAWEASSCPIPGPAAALLRLCAMEAEGISVHLCDHVSAPDGPVGVPKEVRLSWSEGEGWEAMGWKPAQA